MKRTLVAAATVAVATVTLALVAAYAQDRASEAEVRKVIEHFEQGLAERNLAKIEPLMAADVVAFENGHRNDGWQDFRDNHLKPEFEEPAAPSRWEVVRVVATPQMAWGYTKQTLSVTRSNGEKAELLVWSVYVLEQRSGKWKIALLDWSVKAPRPS